MPADSEAASGDSARRATGLSLPHTFRPRGVRVAVPALGAVLLVAVAAVWLAFPDEVRSQFTVLDVGTLIFFGAVFYGIGFALMRSRVHAHIDGLTVVNGFRTRSLAWNEVLAVSLRGGSPWAVLDLADGTSMAAMGIQGSDGVRARAQARQLRELVEQHTR